MLDVMTPPRQDDVEMPGSERQEIDSKAARMMNKTM